MWGTSVALYLFLGGLCAGTFFFTALLQLAHGNRYLSAVRWGAWLSCAFLAAGLACLLLDVAQPMRALNMLESFSNVAGSWMARGAWILLACLAVMLAYALVASLPSAGEGASRGLLRYRAAAMNVVGAVGMVLALLLAGYTGFLLFDAKSVPAWNTLLVPALFLASALENGIALVRVLFRPRNRGSSYSIHATRALRRCAVALLVVEVVILAVFAFYLVDVQAFVLVDGGAMQRGFFVWGAVFLSLLVATLVLAAVEAVRARQSFARTLALAICSLSKGLLLRVLVVLLGVHVPLF